MTKLIQICLPGADWTFLHPLIDAGAMPNLDRLITGGIMGNLFSAPPRNTPTLDATLATGQFASKHGVLHQLVPNETKRGFRRTQGSDWAQPAVWEIASQAGLSAAAVAWPASHPASAFDGLVVSDRFCDDFGRSFDDWTFDPETINDESVAEALADLRMHPSEVSIEMLAPFIQGIDSADFETDPKLGIFAHCLARATTAHAAATWILEHRSPDFLSVHFDFLSVLKSTFTQFCAPKMGHVSDSDFKRYEHVVNGAYQFADMMLGAYLAMSNDDTTLMLVSGHGFQSGDLRPNLGAKGRGANAQRLYRELGILVAKGPGLSEDTLSFGAINIDIAPTTLSILGASAPNLAGRALFDLGTADFKTVDPQLPKRGNFIEEPRSRYRLEQLIGLDLLPTPSATPELASEMIERDGLMTLARSHISERNYAAANNVCDQVLAIEPDFPAGNLTKLDCLQKLKRNAEATALIQTLRGTAMTTAELDFREGELAATNGDLEKARALFETALSSAKTQRSKLKILERIGRTWQRKHDSDAATKAFEMAIAIDPKSATANTGLGQIYLQVGAYENAVKAFLTSLSKLRVQPLAHMGLGQAYLELGQLQSAEASFVTALNMAPDLKPALDGLLKLGEMRANTSNKEGAAS